MGIDGRSVVEELDLTELDTFHATIVVELESELLRVSVNIGEHKILVVLQVEVEVLVSNFVPAAKGLVLEDLNLRGGLSWVVGSGLEADSLEVKLIVELNLNPGTVVVLGFPLVPWFVAMAEEVLRFAIVAETNTVMLSFNARLVV